MQCSGTVEGPLQRGSYMKREEKEEERKLQAQESLSFSAAAIFSSLRCVPSRKGFLFFSTSYRSPRGGGRGGGEVRERASSEKEEMWLTNRREGGRERGQRWEAPFMSNLRPFSLSVWFPLKGPSCVQSSQEHKHTPFSNTKTYSFIRTFICLRMYASSWSFFLLYYMYTYSRSPYFSSGHAVSPSTSFLSPLPFECTLEGQKGTLYTVQLGWVGARTRRRGGGGGGRSFLRPLHSIKRKQEKT